MNKYHYLLVVLVTVYLVIMYDMELPVLLLLLEIILPFVQYVLLVPAAGKLQLQWNSTEQVYETGEEIPVKLWVKNPTVIPILYLHLMLEIQNEFTGEKEKREISLMVPARGTVQVPLGIASEYCGKMTIGISHVCLWDYLHLFHKKKKLKKEYKSQVLVIPALTDLSMEISNLVKGFLTDCDRYDPHEKGLDPSEVFQVRDYQPGDRLQQVHWKLSAAKDGLLVKELSKPLVYPVILFLDLGQSHPFLMQQGVTDALSVLWTLQQKDCPASIVCRQADGTLQKISMASEEDLLPCMEAVCSGRGTGKEIHMLVEYEEQAPGERYAHLYYVTDHIEEETIQLLQETPFATRKTVLWLLSDNEKQTDLKDDLLESGMELIVESEGENIVKQYHWIV